MATSDRSKRQRGGRLCAAITPAYPLLVITSSSLLPITQSPELLRRLLRAKDRMDAFPDQAWPVERLAEVSAVSPAHFARSFKQAFGLPPHRYLLTRRIERAASLLRDTDAPVIDIALKTGWTSIGTFGRIFRDITGESPREYRQRARASATLAGAIPE